MVQKTIVAMLRRIGFKVWVFSDRRRVVTPGIPDLYVLHPGKQMAWWIEVKAPGGQLRPEQRIFAADCEAAGVPHLTVDSVDAFWSWLLGHNLIVEHPWGT